MKKYIKLGIDKKVSKDSPVEENVRWLKDHCLEVTKDGERFDKNLSLHFSFGDIGKKGYVPNFYINRHDAHLLVMYYVEKVVKCPFVVDALFLSSDGDGTDCTYVIEADIYKEV